MTDFLDAFPLEPVRFSHLKNIAKSPAHYRESLLAGSRQTLQMRKGSYADAIVFGTDSEWAVYEGSRRGKAWDDFELRNAQKQIVTASEAGPCEAMAKAVLAHPEARQILRGNTVCQQRIEWSWLGRACAGTPDVQHAEYIADLKTTKCSDPRRFIRDGTFRAYHAQLAWYLDGCRARGGRQRDVFIVAVESAAPYPVTVFKLTERALEAGRKLCRIWMERLLTCERDWAWPGYVQSVVDFDVEDELELNFEE